MSEKRLQTQHFANWLKKLEGPPWWSKHRADMKRWLCKLNKGNKQTKYLASLV